MRLEREQVRGKKQERECSYYAHQAMDEKVKRDCTGGYVCDVCRTFHSFPISSYTVTSWTGL